MLVKLLVICFSVASCVAWLPPERCAQNKVLNNTLTPVKLEPLTIDIADIAAKQHENLLQTYKDSKFVSVPIRAVQDSATFSTPKIRIHAPYNCSFITYDPRLLSSVLCEGVNCKLSHTVTTIDSYTASEGYNWGVKVSSKSSFLNLFEAGGEVSTGGTYSCTYNKGRSTADQVECSDNTNSEAGNLQLYDVQSDMICDFGEITLETDVRDGNTQFTSNDFTLEEITEIISSQLDNTAVSTYSFMIDMDKISEYLLNKIKNLVPLYNPYTDFFTGYPLSFQLTYYKITNSVKKYRRAIPFTKEDGNSVYQYACIKQPF